MKDLGAIKIIYDNLGGRGGRGGPGGAGGPGGPGGGYGIVSLNATEGRGVSKGVTWHFFPKFEPYFSILPCFFEEKRLVFLTQNVTSHRRGWSKIDQKSVTC
jgi:hypothetical protein